MTFNREQVAFHVRELLKALGEDPDREGLKETPRRVAAMLEEMLAGMGHTNQEIGEMFDKTFEEDLPLSEDNQDMVLVREIEFFSYCEHHLALMYNMQAAVAYLPKGKIIGISKIARITEMVGKRLQLQERIGAQVAEIIQQVTGSEDVAVAIRGQHACMTARGVKNPRAVTVTTTLKGKFQTDPALAGQFLRLSGAEAAGAN